MAPEGEGGAAGGVAPEVAPASTVETQTQTPAPVAGAEAKAPPADVPTGAALKAALVTERQAKIADLQAQLAAERAKLAEVETVRAKDVERLTALEAKVEADKAERAEARRVAAFTAAFEANKLAPEYHEVALAQLGKLNPNTDEGKKAIDDWTAARPGLRVKAADAPTDAQEQARAYIAAQAKAMKGTAWGFLTTDAIRDVGVK
jgi:hypothetical protein